MWKTPRSNVIRGLVVRTLVRGGYTTLEETLRETIDTLHRERLVFLDPTKAEVKNALASLKREETAVCERRFSAQGGWSYIWLMREGGR